MSGNPWKQLAVAVVLFVLAFWIAVLVTVVIEHKLSINKIPARMLSPIPLRETLEGTGNSNNLIREAIEGDNGNPWAVSIAYIVGLVVFSGVLIATITNIIRTIGDRYLNGTAHYRFKDHIMFLGYDELMIGTLRNIAEKTAVKQSEIVVAVPENAEIIRNTLHQYLTKEQSKRLYVIKASRVVANDLKRKAQVQRAARIFIIGQPDEATHDANNLKCLGLVAALCQNNTSIETNAVEVERPDGCSQCQNGRSAETVCMYYLRNQSTFYLMHRLAYKPEDFQNSIQQEGLSFDKDKVDRFVKAAEPFNFHESIARHVLFGETAEGDCECLRLNATNGDPHLIIYGMTTMGVALMRDVLMTQHFPGRRLHVTMVDENAQEEMHYIIGRHRPFFENCHYSFRQIDKPEKDYDHPAVLDFLDVDMDFIQCDVANPALSEYLRDCVKRESSGLAIAVCTDDSPKNMALALYMPQQILENPVPIWVYQHGDNSMNSFIENGITDKEENMDKNRHKNIHIFSTMNYGVSCRTPETSEQWRLAKAVSSGYARRPENHVEGPYNWDTEQPKGKWSSLYGAISKKTMMQSLGIDCCPITLTKAQSDIIAKTEHNRWNTEKLLNGWYPADWGLKNEFFHECIRAFEDLDSDHKKRDHKKKDYDQIEDVVNELNEIYNEKANRVSSRQ